MRELTIITIYFHYTTFSSEFSLYLPPEKLHINIRFLMMTLERYVYWAKFSIVNKSVVSLLITLASWLPPPSNNSTRHEAFKIIVFTVSSSKINWRACTVVVNILTYLFCFYFFITFLIKDYLCLRTKNAQLM